MILPNSSSTNMPPFWVKHFLIRLSSIKNWNIKNEGSQQPIRKRWSTHKRQADIVNYYVCPTCEAHWTRYNIECTQISYRYNANMQQCYFIAFAIFHQQLATNTCVHENELYTQNYIKHRKLKSIQMEGKTGKVYLHCKQIKMLRK